MRSACLFEESMGSSAARTGITAPARKVLPPHEKCFQVAYQTKNRPKFKAVCFNPCMGNAPAREVSPTREVLPLHGKCPCMGNAIKYRVFD